MRVVVTGAAGFIGSHTAELLLGAGHEVAGVDCFTDYYDTERKRRNLEAVADHDRWTLHEVDLTCDDLNDVVAGADAVLHLAAQPGVRASWDELPAYTQHNIDATGRLLGAAVRHGVQRVVYASSSSIYGNATTYPTLEDHLPAPRSPYGVTKLAGEQLCSVYAEEHGLSTVALRYFTVYGPRQRPDMAIWRIIEAALGRGAFELYGDGTQVRDFTFVTDVARANVLAATRPVVPGSVFNVSGGAASDLRHLITTIEAAAGRRVAQQSAARAAGDVDRTGGDSSAAAAALGWRPEVSLVEGIAAQVEWQRSAL